MTLTVLGLSGALMHDASAALYIDGRLIAAAEEERFIREKHAKNRMPLNAAKFCMEFGGVKPGDIVSKAEHHPARAGVVIATGVDRDDARRRAERAIEDTIISTHL